MNNKTISEMQKDVDEWANQFEKPYFHHYLEWLL